MATIESMQKRIKDYCDERDWEQFHDPTSLAISVVTEAAELLEPFRFKSKEEALALFKDPKKREHIEEEVADVLYFTLRFAQMNDIDLAIAFENKMKKNEHKYPVEKSKGLNKKYTEL